MKIGDNMKAYIWLWFLVAMSATQGAPYQLTRLTVTGGGGQSTGSVYAVRGSVHQPEAAVSANGGPYSLREVLSERRLFARAVEEPMLTVFFDSPEIVTIWWTPVASGYVLQETASLSPTNWIDTP